MHNRNKQLHALLSQTGLMEHKEGLVLCFTCNRTTHSREMTEIEANELIGYLRQQPDRAEKMRKKILSMAHEMGWHQLKNGRYVIDMSRVDGWMIKFSYLHKSLNSYKYKELPTLVTQFELVYKSFLNKV